MEPMGKEARGVEAGPEMTGCVWGHVTFVGAHSGLAATSVAFLRLMKSPETGKAERNLKWSF